MSILTARFRRRPSSRMRRLLPEALESRQLLSGLRYEIGSPNVVDVWIDPTHGSDANSGSSRITPLRSVNAAWDLVPQGTTLGTGFRLNLMAGRYGEDVFPIWMDGRRGTADAPVILRAADGPGTVEVPAFQVNHCSFIYLVGLYAQAGGDDVLHVAGSDHILIRDTRLVGTGTGYNRPQESLKVNQTQYLFVENCDISGAWGNALDCVSVQYGWIVDSRIHDAEDWVMYLKGGSAYIHVEGNEIYGGGTGGFSAGQGTGFEYMVAPWLHYECYGITVVNNVIHDTEGAGLGVNGSYNVLMAGNTLYRVGRRSHAIEVVQGARGCDG
ncbi:MAG: right-handed parallel beta-helix repeat-containing protein, partial [Isosphaeraceae bacterium]